MKSVTHDTWIPYIRNRQMAVVSDTEGPASSVSAGDDVISVKTLVNGTVDAIKLELELLPTIGEVGSKFEIR